MAIKSFKQFTLDVDFGKEYCGKSIQSPTVEEITYGLLQRITEAIEKMAQGPTVVQAEKRAEDYKREAIEKWGQIQDLRREIKKLKKELRQRDLAEAIRAVKDK